MVVNKGLAAIIKRVVHTPNILNSFFFYLPSVNFSIGLNRNLAFNNGNIHVLSINKIAICDRNILFQAVLHIFPNIHAYTTIDTIIIL
ncbi:hypothetical protein SDC9_192604 [bioreactor metagenome]|uniref:Uncharacterized protein n=1 Tax=bioreactor metagenome TaxID=1076179 RepID=A0A645I175_9ZZZZ